MKHKYILLIALFAVIAGCSVGPKYRQNDIRVNPVYLSLEKGKENASAAKTMKDWWHCFKDPVLNELVRDAHEQNITLEIAAANIKAARSYQAAVASYKVPAANVGAGFAAYKFSENEPFLGPALTMPNLMTGGTGLLSRENSSFFAGATIAWELDLFGRIRQRVKSAGIRSEQAEILRDGIIILMTSEVINNYFQLRCAQSRIDLAERNIQNQRDIYTKPYVQLS